MPLRICLLASEAAPFAKTGGLADVSSALVKYLHGAGHDARLFMPLYSRIDRARYEMYPVDFLQDVALEVGPHRYRYSVFTARMPDSQAFIYLVDCPPLYGRPGIYTQDPDEHLRFLALTRAAIECCQHMGWSPDVVHANDWHTAFAPLLLEASYDWDGLFARTKSVLTIHNIGYQGVFAAGRVADLGLGPKSYLLHQDDLRAGRINSLRHGVMYADVITTVSPTYAREIRTPAYGMGLQDDLNARGEAVVGILNGVDYDEWDPRVDRYLTQHYGPGELAIKADLKRELLKRMRLETGKRAALFGIVSRFTVQKGLDLLFDTLPAVLAQRNACLVALGSGEHRYEELFEGLQRDFPRRVVYHRGYSDELAHWIEAASDIFLMPSLYEPCGLNQMYSLRYGTIPIVRRTGGLADSVVQYDPATKQGTGIVFNDFNAGAMSWALNFALDLYARPVEWQRIVRNAMAQDFSWERQGAEYVALYEGLAGK
jgi:starch synthase